MNTTRDWEKPIRRLELLLRLTSFPVAFKMLEKKEALDQVPFLRRTRTPVTLCQLLTQVRNFDWTVGAELEDFMNPTCPSILGLTEVPEVNRDGTFRSIVWVKRKEDGRRYEAAIPRLPLGRYEAVALAPAVYNPFDPDLLLVYANPAQMILLVNALQFEDYQVMEFFCVGESSCSDAIVRPYQTGKPSLTLPCYGERRYGHAQDQDLVMGLPAGLLDKALKGLEILYRRGIRYPISYAGAESDVSAAFPASYGRLQQLEAIRGNDKRVLLGVTGGIASGKSTVARMLAARGAPIVDLDVLAREVVEPGTPAYLKIVDYFGRQILAEDGTLDRKALSRIVFPDMEKRKKLESFTHPAILEGFVRNVQEIARSRPGAIIQGVVPLMIELNLQYIFHKLLVVHVPQEVQIARLAERDGISREEALTIIRSQLPIDEKVGYADYVIDNGKDLAETERQVEALFQDLKGLQTGPSA